MNIKLGNLNNILEGMNIFLQKELPIKISYKLSRLNKILIEEYQQFEESRKKLIDKYGSKDSDGNLITQDDLVQFNEENRVLFINEFSDLLDIDIHINFEPININELEDIKISPLDLLKLDSFIID
jgi:uncharacterized HAD superfamily protein